MVMDNSHPGQMGKHPLKLFSIMRSPLLFFLLFFLFVPLFAEAISFGASPGVLSFDNMLRDGYAEHHVLISTNSPTPLKVEGELIGNYSDWLSFEPADLRFNVSRSKPFRVKVIVRPPPDISSDQYLSYVRFISQPLGSATGAVGTSLRASVIIRLNLGITGREIKRCVVGGITLPVVEAGYPLLFSSKVINLGNVRIRPKVTLDVWDRFQEKLVTTFDFLGPEILPTVTASQVRELPTDLEPGQYWGFVKVEPCGYSGLLTFDVARKGDIVDKGSLDSVSAKTWALVNETIPVTARFTNLGERFVSARFKGTVKKEDTIVELLESDELRVEPQETLDLQTFFVPHKPGVYEVSGKVLYNRKLTFEKGTIVNVNPTPRIITSTIINILPLFIYVLIFFIIIFLLFRIRRERKRYRTRHNRHRE
ncbi:MAG: hypothetical protein GXP63_01800 [DPANN group archaeon]|nr:hypothetical protein [DPANN group archaeon]